MAWNKRENTHVRFVFLFEANHVGLFEKSHIRPIPPSANAEAPQVKVCVYEHVYREINESWGELGNEKNFWARFSQRCRKGRRECSSYFYGKPRGSMTQLYDLRMHASFHAVLNRRLLMPSSCLCHCHSMWMRGPINFLHSWEWGMSSSLICFLMHCVKTQ